MPFATPTENPAGPAAPSGPSPWSPGGAVVAGAGQAAAPAPSPGNLDINLLDPVGSGAENIQKASGILSDLGDLVGQSPIGALARGINSIPVLGNVTQLAGNALGGIGAAATGAIGHAADAVGGALEDIPNPLTAFTGGQQDLQKQFNAVPDSDAKAAIQAEIAANPGNAQHLMYQFTEDYAKSDAGLQAKPTLNPEFSTTATTLADTLGELLGVFPAEARSFQRTVANIGGGGGLARLDAAGPNAKENGILGNNHGLFGSGIGPDILSGGTQGQSPQEAIAYQKWSSGEWSKDQALDYLYASGQGLAHDQGQQLVGSIVADPMVFGSLGASGIAALGAKALEVVAEGGTILKAADAAEGVADAAKVTEEGAQAVSAARTAVGKGVDAVKTVAGVPGKVLGAPKALAAAALDSEAADPIVRYLGNNVFKALTEDDGVTRSLLGLSAYIARSIVDPLHAIAPLFSRATNAMLDLTSEVSQKVMMGTYGWGDVIPMNAKLEKLFAVAEAKAPIVAGDAKTGMDDIRKAQGTYSANSARRVLAEAQRDAQLRRGLQGAEDLVRGTPTQTADALAGQQSKSMLGRLASFFEGGKEDFSAVADSEKGIAQRENLVTRLETMFGEDKDFKGLVGESTPNQLSYLHAITYGHAQVKLAGGIVEAIRDIGQEAANKLKINRLVILNAESLTRGAAGDLVKELRATLDKDFEVPQEMIDEFGSKQAYLRQVITDAQKQYPELAAWGKMPASGQENWITKFADKLEDHIGDGSMMNELRDKELQAMPDAVKQLQAMYGKAFKLGIRPDDSDLWGLTKDLDGNWIGRWSPYLDTVTAEFPNFRPGFNLAKNIMGQTIPGKYIGGVLDTIEAAGRTLGRHVDAAMVQSNAQTRFRAFASELHGLDKGQADQLFNRLNKVAQLGEQTVRSLSAKDMWQATQDLIHDFGSYGARGGEQAIGQKQLMTLTLRAFEGDLRYVGLTQKLSGAAKAFIGEKTGGNMIGQLAEGYWPAMKYKWNGIFQVQQKLEGWSLNTIRGNKAAFGVKLDAAGRETLDILNNLATTSVQRMADYSIIEQSGVETYGSTLEKTLTEEQQGIIRRALNVRATKQVNYVNTAQANLGKTVRAAFSQAWEDGDQRWLRIKNFTAASQGVRSISDDEMASRLLLNGADLGDIRVPRFVDPGQEKGLYDGVRLEKDYQTPTNIGELQRLDIGQLAKHLNLPIGERGDTANTAGKLIKALGNGDLKWSDVEAEMAARNFHPDQIARINSAIHFNLPEFWGKVRTAFNVDPDRMTAVQMMMDHVAAGRGMNTLDFMSQFFGHDVAEGAAKEGDIAPSLATKVVTVTDEAGDSRQVAEMQHAVNILRAGEDATPEDLMNQIGSALYQHLDPSMRQALEDEAGAAVDAARPGTAGEQALQNSIKDHLYPQPTQPWTARDLKIGVGDAKTVAQEYVEAHPVSGLQPAETERHFAKDPEFGKRTADAYDALPDAGINPGDTKVTLSGINRAGHKVNTEGMEPRDAKSWQDFVRETEDQYNAMRKAGVKVEVNPDGGFYKNSDAMRADVRQNGRLVVDSTGSAHPVMTDAQNIRFRAVHDYFAHAATGEQFGPEGELNAAISHSQMYSPSARRAMLTESHGQNSVVNYSEQRVNEADPDLYTQRFHGGDNRPVASRTNEPGYDFAATGPVDQSIRELPPEQRDPIMRTFARERQVFPGIEIRSINAREITASDLTAGAHQGGNITISRAYATDPATAYERSLYGQQVTHVLHPVGRDFGASEEPAARLLYTTIHETMHALSQTAEGPGHRASRLFLAKFSNEIAKGGDLQKAMSLYGNGTAGGRYVLGSLEGMEEAKAELGVAAFGPDVQVPAIVNEWAVKYRKALQADGLWTGEMPFARNATLAPAAAPFPGAAEAAKSLTGDASADAKIKALEGRRAAERYITSRAGEAPDGYLYKRVINIEDSTTGASPAGWQNIGDLAEDTKLSPTTPGRQVLRVKAGSAGVIGYSPEKIERLADDGSFVPLRYPRGAVIDESHIPVAKAPTVAEANAAKPGSVYAQQKAGLLPDDITSEFAQRYLGVPAEVGPRTAAATAEGSKFVQGPLQTALGTSGETPTAMTDILKRAVGIPTVGAAPFNPDEARFYNVMQQAIDNAEGDAFRLHYFNRSRSVLERSINHPMFGLYPASYMWGKIGPELVRFLAKSPFGVETGGLAYAIHDTQMALAAQYEYDPKFQAFMKQLGASESAFFLGYLLPGVPWDLSAGAPAWMRAVQKQVEANQGKVDANGAPMQIDLGATIKDAADAEGAYLSPFRQVDQTAPEIKELGGLGNAAGAAVNGAVNPKQSAPTPAGPDFSQPVQATGLSPILSAEQQALKQLLQGQ